VRTIGGRELIISRCRQSINWHLMYQGFASAYNQKRTLEFYTPPTHVIPAKVTEGNALGCRNPEAAVLAAMDAGIYSHPTSLTKTNDSGPFDFKQSNYCDRSLSPYLFIHAPTFCIDSAVGTSSTSLIRSPTNRYLASPSTTSSSQPASV